MQFNDNVRGLIIELLRAIFPALVLFDVVDWTPDQISSAVIISGMVIGLAFAIFKTGQQPSTEIKREIQREAVRDTLTGQPPIS